MQSRHIGCWCATWLLNKLNQVSFDGIGCWSIDLCHFPSYRKTEKTSGADAVTQPQSKCSDCGHAKQSWLKLCGTPEAWASLKIAAIRANTLPPAERLSQHSTSQSISGNGAQIPGKVDSTTHWSLHAHVPQQTLSLTFLQGCKHLHTFMACETVCCFLSCKLCSIRQIYQTKLNLFSIYHPFIY